MLIRYIAGAAAIALAATALHAQSGGEGGQGKGGASDQAGVSGQAKRPKGGHTAGRDQEPQQAEAQTSGPGKAKGPYAGIAPPRAGSKTQARRADRAPLDEKTSANSPHTATSSKKPGPAADQSSDRYLDGQPFRWARLDRREIVRGCPPGLAKKANGCSPPGLAKVRFDDWRSGYDRPDWWGLDGYDGQYSYNDGQLLRLGSNGSIVGYLPLLGGALAPGKLWPAAYQPVTVPSYYQDYYNLGPSENYRYYDDAFYSVDPASGVIGTISALLTGDDFVVGQAMPEGYDVYNVPYSYRDEYGDGLEANYRYSDGYVYEVDPTTQLVQASIKLLE